jgi:hypothetical protein
MFSLDKINSILELGVFTSSGKHVMAAYLGLGIPSLTVQWQLEQDIPQVQ